MKPADEPMVVMIEPGSTATPCWPRIVSGQRLAQLDLPLGMRVALRGIGSAAATASSTLGAGGAPGSPTSRWQIVAALRLERAWPGQDFHGVERAAARLPWIVGRGYTLIVPWPA
jgi:hypothetical protein